VQDRALAARALEIVEDVRGVQAQLRVPRSPTEQLAVTHLFAARRYAIVGVGLDRRIAVAPVERRYPSVRFTSAAPSQDAIARALAASAR
jgi:hypothetical protein